MAVGTEADPSSFANFEEVRVQSSRYEVRGSGREGKGRGVQAWVRAQGQAPPSSPMFVEVQVQSSHHEVRGEQGHMGGGGKGKGVLAWM